MRSVHTKTSTLPRLAVFGILVLAIVLLAACGAAPATNGAPLTATSTTIRATTTPLPPTSVTIVRFSTTDRQVAPFQRTTQDATKIHQLYRMLDTLPYKSPSGGSGCLLVTERMGYELSFMHDNTLVLQVVLQGGCPGVHLSSSSDCRQWTLALTTQIAATFDVSTSTVAPLEGLINTTGPNGPFAQPAPTPPVLVPMHCF